MDKVTWKLKLKSLEDILKKKKDALKVFQDHTATDIEELEFTIDAYKKKIASLK